MERIPKLCLKSLIIAILSIAMSSCTPSFQAEYSDPESREIIDEKWNEADGKKSAEELIHSMLTKEWLSEFAGKIKTKPRIMIGKMENRTDEFIDLKALVEAVRYELINSGKIQFVDNLNRSQIQDEIDYQQNSGMVAADKKKSKGKQSSADFLLSGALSSQVHTQGGVKTVSYQIVMQLTNLETADIVWTQKYDGIKKKFKRSSTGW